MDKLEVKLQRSCSTHTSNKKKKTCGWLAGFHNAKECHQSPYSPYLCKRVHFLLVWCIVVKHYQVINAHTVSEFLCVSVHNAQLDEASITNGYWWNAKTDFAAIRSCNLVTKPELISNNRLDVKALRHWRSCKMCIIFWESKMSLVSGRWDCKIKFWSLLWILAAVKNI